MLGTCLVFEGKFQDGMRYFQKALNLDANYIEALSGMGHALSSCN